MRDVARVVKRRLNEGMYDFDVTNTDDDVDVLVNKERLRNAKKLDYHEGFAVVIDEESNPVQMNYVDLQGNLLLDEWYRGCWDFKNGFGRVSKVDSDISHHRYRIYNMVDKNGNLISEQWFDDVSDFNEGFAKVFIERQGWNFINERGEFLSDEWFRSVREFTADGYARVERLDKYGNQTYNFINKNGRFLFKMWFDDNYVLGDFCNGFVHVARYDIVPKGKENLMDVNGKFISDEWFDRCYNFNNYGLAHVRVDGKSNLIKKNGRYLFKNWYKEISGFFEGYAVIKRVEDGKRNFTDPRGRFLLKEWTDMVLYDFINGFAEVKKEVWVDEWNYMDKNGNLLSDEWFYHVWAFEKNGEATVMKDDGKYYIIDKYGNLTEK